MNESLEKKLMENKAAAGYFFMGKMESLEELSEMVKGMAVELQTKTASSAISRLAKLEIMEALIDEFVKYHEKLKTEFKKRIPEAVPEETD